MGSSQIVVQSLETGERRTIINRERTRGTSPTGHLVVRGQRNAFRRAVRRRNLAVTGAAVAIVEGVARATSITGGASQYAFSDSGSMVYVPGPASAGRLGGDLFDRKGRRGSLESDTRNLCAPRVSPDGKRLALETRDSKEANVAIYELSGASAVRRLTFGGNNRYPIWSSDRRRVAFQSDRDGAARCTGSRPTAARPSGSPRPIPGRPTCQSRGRRPATVLVQRRERDRGVALDIRGLGIEGRPVRRREVVRLCDGRGLFARRPMGGVSDPRSGAGGRDHLRAAFPPERKKVSDRTRWAAGVVS